MQGSPKYHFSYAFTVGNDYILTVIIYVILCMCILYFHCIGLKCVQTIQETLGMIFNTYSLKYLLQNGYGNLSIKARTLCLSVCVCLKYLCRSGSDWPESFNMAAAWFKGVQRRIYLDYDDTVNKWFQKCFTNSASIANHSHHSHVRTRANHCTP